jgi:hypothetical protein
VTAHLVVEQRMPAPAAVVFDLLHDYGRRLEWDTLLRRAEVVGDDAPAAGVETVCTARWYLGGFAFRTRYVTFRRPDLAAVALTGSVLVFATWAASVRHRDEGGGSRATYTLTFTCRPRWLAWLVEPVAAAAFRIETARRLAAMSRYLRDREDNADDSVS